MRRSRRRLRGRGALLVQVLGAQSAAAASNAMGAVQLVLLLLVTQGGNRSSDAFVILFGFGQAALQIYVIPVLYPRRLSGGDTPHWHRHAVWAAVGSLACTVGGAGLLLAAGFPSDVLLTLTPVVAASSAATTFAGCIAVDLAARGRPVPLAALALAANSLAVLLLLCTLWADRLDAVLGMCIALCVGNIITAISYRWHRVAGTEPIAQPLRAGKGSLSGSVWLAAGSLVGYGGFLGLQTAAAKLPAGEATAYALVVKIGLGLIGVGLVAALPAISNRLSGGEGALQAIAGFALPLAGSVAVVSAFTLMRVQERMPFRLAPMFVLWVVGAGITTVAAQVLNRRGDFGGYRLSTLLTAAIYGAGITTMSIQPHVLVAICTLAAAGTATAARLAHRCGWRATWLTVLLLAVSATCSYAAPVLVVPFALACGLAAVVFGRSARGLPGSPLYR